MLMTQMQMKLIGNADSSKFPLVNYPPKFLPLIRNVTLCIKKFSTQFELTKTSGNCKTSGNL